MENNIEPILQQVIPEQTQTKLKDKECGTVHCDRCSGAMFRMRAVYWCTNCGYKTDCCGH